MSIVKIFYSFWNSYVILQRKCSKFNVCTVSSRTRDIVYSKQLEATWNVSDTEWSKSHTTHSWHKFYLSKNKLHWNQKTKNNVIFSVGNLHLIQRCMYSLLLTLLLMFDATWWRSADQGCHKFRETMRPPKNSLNICIVEFAVCTVALSCGNQQSCSSTSKREMKFIINSW
jgi:hypothetical protein